MPPATFRLDEGERGDWSYIASFTLALAMLGALALATDAQALAYGHGRLWAATTVAGRAAARCLAPATLAGGSGSVQACADTAATMVLTRSLSGDRLSPGTVRVQVNMPTHAPATIALTATASLPLPFALPGVARANLTDQVTTTLAPQPVGSQ